MKQEQFERAHREEWAAFAARVAAGSRKAAGPAEGAEALPLPAAYRRICQHLALARDRRYTAGLVQRLNGLALAGHRVLYGAHLDLAPRWAAFLAGGLARSVRALARPVLLAALLFTLPAGLLPLVLARDPSAIYLVEDPSTLARLERMYQKQAGRFGRANQSSTDLAMFGFYIWNNVRISFQAFAGGLVLGLGSVFYLLFNGLHFGAAAGYLTQAGLGAQFWPFVCTHSAFELPALVLAGAAGLHLGWALLAPGRRSRSAALAAAARDGIPLVYGAALMDLLAACIEAFWSASARVPPALKLGTAAALWTAVLAYLLLAGRHRD
jgi:uncharacterized membrane protein SpoIIM required for sporulation